MIYWKAQNKILCNIITQSVMSKVANVLMLCTGNVIVVNTPMSPNRSVAVRRGTLPHAKRNTIGMPCHMNHPKSVARMLYFSRDYVHNV